mgnify:CR=1 FL=1
MKLFEFEAKNILRKYGVVTPKGDIAKSLAEAERIARKIGKPVVLKAQVVVSSRGKSGGIIFVNDVTAAREAAVDLIGSTIKGSIVRSLLVEERVNVAEEFYASVTIDRQARRYIVLGSTTGGIDIEQVALASPDRITRHWVDPAVGFSQSMAESMVVKFSNLDKHDSVEFASILHTLHSIAMDYDAELVEINPLAKTDAGQFIAVDARITIDDNALFRHPEFQERSLVTAGDSPWEAKAKQENLTYVDLDGNIGIIGNGAGLVMATLDLVYLSGGRPANFLDVGGGAGPGVVKRAVELVISKPEVAAILVNILGGVTRCDLVAQGIIEGFNESTARKHVVVRLMGTNEDEGAHILHRAGIHTHSSMEEAVREVLKFVS